MIDIQLNLPENYLSEEERFGYTIPADMKEVWAVMLDLFAEFDRVCKKHHIHYMASGGTLLGAVRHKGFIPWDDDMDLMMKRDDYEKLCEVAITEFKHPYFFQTYQTDQHYNRAYAKLRNSETTSIQKNSRHVGYKYNQGIFIDIFPLDAVAPTPISKKIQKFKCNYYMAQAAHSVSLKNNYQVTNGGKLFLIDQFLYRILGGLHPNCLNVEHNMKKLTYWCKKYSSKNPIYYSKLSFQPKNEKQLIPLNDIEDLILMDFEFLKIPVPKNFDEYLRRRYGDYMTPLNTGGYHGELFFDTNHSFKMYIDV